MGILSYLYLTQRRCMAQRATEKIMEALSQLLEGFAELQDGIESEIGEDLDESEDEEDETESETLDPDAAIVKEMKVAIEGAIETDDYSPEEVANLIASLTEALEEIDPNIFSEVEEEEEEEEEEDYDDDDDLDFDEDDYEDEDEDDEDEDDE